MDTTINVKELTASEIAKLKDGLFERRDRMMEDEYLRHQRGIENIQHWLLEELSKLDDDKSGDKCECSCRED